MPKKPSKVDPIHGELFLPSRTRPLSVVNTDNRLVANAYRFMLEPILNRWVSDMQRGFLTGRSMLANIVEVDYHAMKISLMHDRGALVLFDFEAAFPSVSQEFMWEMLTHIGFAPGNTTAVHRQPALHTREGRSIPKRPCNKWCQAGLPVVSHTLCCHCRFASATPRETVAALLD